MTLEYDVCTADMDECSKKCKTVAGTVADCNSPCACYGSYYYFEKSNGKCRHMNPPEESCLKKPGIGGSPGGETGGAGYACNGLGGTWVSYCTQVIENGEAIGPYVEACANFGGEDGECYIFCGSALKACDYSVYQSSTVPGYGDCCRPILVLGFSGVFLEPSEPFVNEYWAPNYPWFNPYISTCGGFAVMRIIANSYYGPVYIGYYSRIYFLTPFTNFNNTISTQANIYIRPDINEYGTGTCQTCGVEGKPDCLAWDELPESPPYCPEDPD